MDVTTVLADWLANTASTMINTLYNPRFYMAMGLAFGLIAFDVFRKGWRQSITHRAITGSLASVGVRFLNILFVPFVFYAVTFLQAGYDYLAIPSIPASFWEGVPFWVAGILAIVLHDFADYWNHRAMHTYWLWPVHAVHHSDQEVNGFTTFRIHFLEAIIMRASYIFFVSWAGFSAEAASFGAVIFLMHNVYVHANLDWDHGPFKMLVASPRFHRWHHANDEAAYGKNLANLMPIYDYMFGTYHNPHPCRSPMGADGVPHSDVIKLMLFPFTEWTKYVRKALSKKKQLSGRQIVEPAE